MALKDIWKHLDSLWSTGKKGGFGLLLGPGGFGVAHVFRFSEYSSLFLLLKPHAFTSFPICLLPCHPPGAPPTPMPCLPFELPGTPGHSIWAAGPLCRCTGCRLSSWRGKREVCWPLPKTGSTHRLCSIWLLDFPNQEGCFIPGKRSTPMPTVNLPWILFVSRSIKLKR